METEHVAVDIHVPEAADHEVPGEPNNTEIKQMTDFVEKNTKKVPSEPFKTRPVTIFRFPSWFHEINKDLCEPRVVSIGPYHRGKESLRPMEENKWSTLRDFLARNKNVPCEEYLQEMRMLEAQARVCYSENVKMASNDFVMMLLLDGCFILEYLIQNHQQKYWDAIFDVRWVRMDIRSDLFLMENQLPFSVLHKLFAIQRGCGQICRGPCVLLELIFKASNAQGRVLRLKRPKMSCGKIQIHHLLHFFYSHMKPGFQLGREQTDSVPFEQSSFVFQGFQSFPWFKIFSKSGKAKLEDDASRSRDINIPCVTELHEAGVKFRIKRNPRDTFDITFKNGTMEIPCIYIDSITKIILWNMAGFEQTQLYSEREIVSSYLDLMDSLINTEKDVAILDRAGIIDNLLQNEEEAATFFNQFGRILGLDYSDHSFYELCKELKRYSESTWHKSRTRLMHDYFNNPWSAISVVAATILLILTFLQTYYSATK